MKSAFLFLLVTFCLSFPVYADEKLDQQLFFAIGQGDYKRFLELLDAGANVNAKKEASGITVLMQAAAHKQENMVRILLARKADVKAKTKQGSTVLIHAMKSTNSIIRALIRAGADVNADNGYYSPLLLAVIENRPDRIDILLDAGAKVNFENDEGESALYYAALKGHTACIQKLLEAKADCVSPVMRAVSGSEPEIRMAELLQNLFDAGVSVNLTDKEGRTALMIAAKNRKNLCLKTLLANKADVKIKDKSGKTALDYAKENLNDEGAKLLLKKNFLT